MRRVILASALVALVRTASPAAPGDDVDDSVPASVTARLDAGVARFVARYRIRVEGPVHARNVVSLQLPRAGVAVKATATADGPGEGTARALDLVPAATGLARYEAFGARPAGPARRWAVYLEGHGQLDVSIAAPRAATVTLDLEVQAPACLFRDARHVQVPESWVGALPAARKRPELSEACGTDGPDTWISFPDKALAARPAGTDRVGANAASATLEDGSQIARFELGLAGMLGEIPPDLATAIVLDTSRSMTPKLLETQRDVVAAYLRAAPQAQVQVIAYARRARALLPGWEVARHAHIRIERELRALAPRNGSNYDAGLAEAAAWLARVRGTRRIVLVTDEWRGPRLTALPDAELRRLVGADTLVHVVAVDEFSSQPTRDDAALLAGLAHGTRGMAVRTGPMGKGETRDVISLLRPVSLDELVLQAPGWAQIQGMPACDTTLAEGRSCTWWLHGARAMPIAASGMVWGTRVDRVLRPDPARGLDVVRELAGGTAIQGHDLAERVAVAARAVGPAWSMIVEWGGQDGYADGVGMISRCSHCSGGFRSRSAHVGVGHVGAAAILPPLDARAQLAGPVERCLATGDEVSVAIATTLSEITDVRATLHSSAPPARETELRACVEDAVWDTAITVPPILRTSAATMSFARY